MCEGQDRGMAGTRTRGTDVRPSQLHLTATTFLPMEMHPRPPGGLQEARW